MKRRTIILLSGAVFINCTQLMAQWQTGGNALVANGVLGNNNVNGFHIYFRSDNVDRGVLTNNGLWHFGSPGIPGAKVQITHNSAASTPQLLLFENENDFARLHFKNNTTPNHFAIAGLPAVANASAKLNFTYTPTGPVMTVQGDGRVGIGNNSPTARLHVSHNSSGTDPQLLLNETENNDYSRINFKNPSTANWYSIAAKPAVNNADATLNIYYNSVGNIMTLRGNGNVGIGIVNPANKLEVCGTIRSKEIIVEAGWCDYVFDTNYRLRPLDEVAAYVARNKHLPNIPPASEIEKKGLKVADMSAKMMEKIEELTLYLIDLNNRFKALENENKALLNQVANQNK